MSKQERADLFLQELQELLWRHDAELNVEITTRAYKATRVQLMLDFSYGDSVELPRSIEGKAPTP